jgi:hypothetical protein
MNQKVSPPSENGADVGWDFTGMEEKLERGKKRAGEKVAAQEDAEKQRTRERGVLLVVYFNDGDVPDSPSEPFLEELVASQNVVPPKTIPFPQELKVCLLRDGTNAQRGQQGGGSVATQVPAPAVNNSDVTAILSSLLGGSGQQYPPAQPPPPALQPPDLTAILQTLSSTTSTQQSIPSFPPAPVNLDLAAILSQFAQPPRRQSPPLPRRGKKRDAESRIKATRLDDIRESVRNANIDQSNYRALCQFYVRSHDGV